MNGKQPFLRAVDQDGDVLDVYFKLQRCVAARAAVSSALSLRWHLVLGGRFLNSRVRAFSEWGRLAI